MLWKEITNLERNNMPAGDYTNCTICGRAVFNSSFICKKCTDNCYSRCTSYDVYGYINNLSINPGLPPTPNNDVPVLINAIKNKSRSDAKKHIDTLTSVMGEQPISDNEFEEFWKIMNEPDRIEKQYFEKLDKDENVECGCKHTPVTDEEFETLMNELETNVDDSESLEEIFDNLFTEHSSPVPNKLESQPIKRQTLIVNLFAGPGSGKSTTAAGIFFELKSRGINCEIATEFVKDLVWEQRHKAINNQIYIFAKQHHRITRLIGEVDVVITDSPLLLTLVYDKNKNPELKNLAKLEHDNLWTYNCFIKRNKEYNPKGRWQTFDEARDLDRSIATMLDQQNVPYQVYFGNNDGKDRIVNNILKILGHKQ